MLIHFYEGIIHALLHFYEGIIHALLHFYEGMALQNYIIYPM